MLGTLKASLSSLGWEVREEGFKRQPASLFLSLRSWERAGKRAGPQVPCGGNRKKDPPLPKAPTPCF